ncbi:hypothetical protein N7468_005252 [Penicillium chermesinum]|uniref:Uncharacterized protein n=1 Tax=Penicillium chermesinum TaxID=63820 RepID=A0A9W9TMT5_9EURO|nr:uncharacterized protein N7468_005252 [Penicillium chermesinum]KAJ5232296.1 hypothetical protein N7468_005252 [Penicillium chermesinum]KAJ6171950.1 hypothetical protein N7470_001017 [Penicillium chermesinum]
METRQAGRKRCNSSISNSRNTSPVSHRTRQSTAALDSAATQPAATPKRSRKRVRFSDPGPQLHETGLGCTGLTPAMKRTCFSDRLKRPGTPSRKSRRQSAPIPGPRRDFDAIEPFEDESSERVVQFTPLRQILDMRTKRRIRRIGLSDEINHIQREKREHASFEKTLATLLQERDALQEELRSVKRRSGQSDQPPPYDSFWRSFQGNAQQMEEQTTLIHDGASVASSGNLDDPTLLQTDGDTFMLNESALITSDSPIFRHANLRHSPVPEGLSLLEQMSNDVSTQTERPDEAEHYDVHNLAHDLQAARSEKHELFNVCRSQMSVFENSEIGDMLRQTTPPPDFLENVISTLTTALARASDATETLEGISEQCSSLGFSGARADDVLSEMREHFRAARLELERAIPGETADVGLEDGKATLSALVKRVKSLARELRAERKYHFGSLGREKALRGQFDNLLHRYEAATDKISSLEESIASSASDMLHTRMRMQDMENEDQEKTVGIDRLNTALDKYHDDMKSLEELVSKLESENAAAKEKYMQQITILRKQIASERKERSAIEISASESEVRIRRLEETVEQNQIRACDLTAQVEALEKEHTEALRAVQDRADQRAQQQEQDIGILNVRISDLTTSLDTARSEAQRLQRLNASLKVQLRMEMDARDELMDKWAAEQARSFALMKETVSSERRKAKVRAANWELKSEDLMSDGTTVNGSDPITPVSMTRFVDVECGRGKDRRRMDSGVGILTEDLLESEAMSDLYQGLNSEPDLPAL